jgi:hypothetical protein
MVVNENNPDPAGPRLRDRWRLLFPSVNFRFSEFTIGLRRPAIIAQEQKNSSGQKSSSKQLRPLKLSKTSFARRSR